MARGKTKLRKVERAAYKTPSVEAKQAAARSLVWDWDSHAHDDDGDWEDDFCDHENLKPSRMARVKELLSELFSSSFKLAVPSLFRGMVQNLQDQVLKEKITSFIEHGFNPDLIEQLADDSSTREGICTQIVLACKEELADVVLRLSTEDSFDLLCDLAVRHGRDLNTWGPPCACSFSRCLPCLERLVESIKATPPMPPAEIKPIESTALIDWIKKNELFDSIDAYDSDDEENPNGSWVDDVSWQERVSSAWEKMASILWQFADKIDPLEIARVKGAHNTLRKLDGLDLYYTVVTREVAEERTRKDLILGADSATRLYLSKHYERMKKENRKLSGKSAISGAGIGTGSADDWAGVEYRKALARAIREKGNQAYSAARYQDATDQYTRAIGYDATEPIYPLNRAACLLKLRRFSEAERDCTAAILLDASNHKAHFRRGVSRAGLGKTDEAKEDFEEVLRLQKGNPEVREELRKLSERFLTESSRRADSMDTLDCDTGHTTGSASKEAAQPVMATSSGSKGKAKAPRGAASKVLDISLESTPASSPQLASKAAFESTTTAAAAQGSDAEVAARRPPSSMKASEAASSQATSSTSTSKCAPGGRTSSSQSYVTASSTCSKLRAGPNDDDKRTKFPPLPLLLPAKESSSGPADSSVSPTRRDAGTALPDRAPSSLSEPMSQDKATTSGATPPQPIEQETATSATTSQGVLATTATPSDPEVESLQNWLRRTREVLIEIQFAHYFSLVLERETGAKLDNLLDCELYTWTMKVLEFLGDRKRGLQEGKKGKGEGTSGPVPA